MKTLTLNTGAKIPAIGLGTWEAREGECYRAVMEALKLGYLHIDTASSYENEEEIGRAIRDSGVPREEIFLTTKVPSIWLKQPQESLDLSLQKLGLDYVDLLLVHWPVVMVENGTDFWRPVKPDGVRNIDAVFDYKKVWRLFEQIPPAKARAIGVSNFDTVQLQDLLENCTTVPAMNQVELHPYLPQQKLLDFCWSKGIQCTAFCPLGQKMAHLRDDPVVNQVASSYGISPAQCLISWAVERGTIAIPKSSNPDRLAQNLKTVALATQDVAKLTAIFDSKKVRTTRPNFGVPLFQDDDWYEEGAAGN